MTAICETKMTSLLLKRKVLIVDDESSIREVLRRYFTKKGFDVLLASSGKEALEAFSENQPHIVLLDILMPGCDGLETLKELKKMLPSVKVIMISAVKNEEVFHKCLKLGALDYIVKPFELLDLHARVFGKLLC